MSFLRRLFCFFDFKNDEIPQMPKPLYPFTPDLYPRKKTLSILLAKPINQEISTQTEQTISNLVTKESETDINIPTTFVPKETSFSYLSSRFVCIDHKKKKSSNQLKSSSCASQNSEPEDHKNLQDTQKQEFSIGSSQILNSKSKEKPQINDENENQDRLASSNPSFILNSKENTSSKDTFSFTNFKAKQERSIDNSSSEFKIKNEDQCNAGTFSFTNFKARQEKSINNLSSEFEVKNEDQSNADTFSFTNFKKRGDKNSADTSHGSNFITSENQSTTDTFSLSNFKRKDQANVTNSSSQSNPETDKKLNNSLSPQQPKQNNQNANDDTFSFSNFKSRSNKENSSVDQKSNEEKVEKSKDLDIDAIRALIRQKFPSNNFSTDFETNFSYHRRIIQNERGGFNYTRGFSKSYSDRGAPDKSNRGKSGYNRHFKE